MPPDDARAERGLRYVYGNGVELIHGGPAGITFVGASGSIFVDRTRLGSNPEKILQEPLGDKDVHLGQTTSLVRDWLDCLRTRRRPICDVELGARSATVAHLGNLAYWNRRKLHWDADRFEVTGDREATQRLTPRYRSRWTLPKA